jgi:hypothetical protein
LKRARRLRGRRPSKSERRRRKELWVLLVIVVFCPLY